MIKCQESASEAARGSIRRYPEASSKNTSSAERDGISENLGLVLEAGLKKREDLLNSSEPGG